MQYLPRNVSKHDHVLLDGAVPLSVPLSVVVSNLDLLEWNSLTVVV